MVSVNSKTQTFTNGTPNDAGPVDAEFVSAFNNDATLATAVTDIENGSVKTATTLTINSAYTGGTPGNMAFMAERGTQPNVGFRWNETDDRWEVTHNGTDYYPLELVLATEPTTTEDGFKYYDTVLKRWRYWDATEAAFLSIAHTGELSGLPKGYLGGPAPTYLSASTVRIPSGFRCRDDADAVDIVAGSNLDVVLSGSGALGLDTGAEAGDTWYYLWVIRKSSDGTVSAIFSTSASSPTLPSGYDQKRLLPGAWRNNGSSNIIPGYFKNYGPNAVFMYSDATIDTQVNTGGYNVYFNFTTNPTSFGAATDCSALVPPVSTEFLGYLYTDGAGSFYYRKNGGAGSIRVQGGIVSSQPVETDSSQDIQIYADVAGRDVGVWVLGWTQTSYTNGF